LSLHYWDWTQGATFLFTTNFIGSANGSAGEPWLSAGFYNPNADPYRSDDEFDTLHNNPVDPPKTLTRNYVCSTFPIATDNAIVNAGDFKTMWNLLESAHNSVHGFIGGTLGHPHILPAAGDPMGYLGGVPRVVYRGVDNHLHEIWLYNNQWNYFHMTE
jgi:hypothetical protein